MVEFTPAHAHPFSVSEAETLDVGTIVGEINRLRNSLDHLATSQAELKAYLDDDDDADLRAAWVENEGVVASQTERITLLRHVLASKVGEDSLAHYGIESATAGDGVNGSVGGAAVAPAREGPTTVPATGSTTQAGSAPPGDDDGLHL